MKIAMIAVLLAVAGAQAYQQPNYKSSEYSSPMPYSFAWDVNDDASDNHYAHSESSNGHAVTGSYRVALPDGRTQIVTYRADSNGYVADVKYEGQARYPEYKPVSSYSAPVYQTPAPIYRAPTSPAYRAPVAPAYRAPAATSARRGSTVAPGYVSLPVPLAYRG
ncbi:cuticle protein 18.6-like [Daphnia carinata]|uniref:cuticle protein 18.6-like n=1 Tax=Daphnia carinata TaxID=120202 RepID=UPI002580D0F3|nr:cuticle protein 18.6-like [Daphnia carinata]